VVQAREHRLVQQSSEWAFAGVGAVQGSRIIMERSRAGGE
jgi:hypothetical protein